MTIRIPLFLLLLTFLSTSPAYACCAVSPGLQPAINADQTVIILWNAETKTQHFIRQASFKSESQDLGFIVPTPSQPQLNESGNEAFAYLDQLTAPPIIEKPTPMHFPIGCSKAESAVPDDVRILEQKRVAGFDAVILEADSASALKTWLAQHGYAFSPQVEAWAAPYIASGWKFTAMKVAKNPSEAQIKSVSASALRMSFQTDRPLFPYREPASAPAAQALEVYPRILKIYFIAQARYQGGFTPQQQWQGRTIWANRLSPANLAAITNHLGLPNTTIPNNAWLTVFNDNWLYARASADLYFSLEATQQIVLPEPRIRYVSRFNTATFALVGVLALIPFIAKSRRKSA